MYIEWADIILMPRETGQPRKLFVRMMVDDEHRGGMVTLPTGVPEEEAFEKALRRAVNSLIKSVRNHAEKENPDGEVAT